MTTETAHRRAANTLHAAARSALAVAALMILCPGPAHAHVGLDFPNGGETFIVGSTVTIAWSDEVYHGPADFDLWYSTTGPDGPWIVIASDLYPAEGPRSYSSDWTVPDTPSDTVRIRVRQDNADTDYDAVSEADLAIVAASSTAAETIVLVPERDATLYEGDGGLANGAGSFLFAGRTESTGGSAERRALLAFPVAGSIPAGATITSVSLELTMSRSIAGAQPVELRRVLESWSEGPTDAPGQEGSGAATQAGDVTWVHREAPGTNWSTLGGTFSSTASGSLQIDGTGPYTWQSTSELVADVQAWLDDPSSNHGWALVMPSPPTGSAKRFNSRENSGSTSRPQLTVSYEASAEAPVAAFAFAPESPRVGETVTFTDQSTGGPTTWLWDFGDGDSSSEQNPGHAFESAGTFTVTLAVDNGSAGDTTSAAVTVLADAEPELTEMIFIPAAANVQGSGTSFFVTTVDVHNGGATTASYRFLWLPRDTDNADPQESATYTLSPGEVRRFANVLTEVFAAGTAVGALAVISDSAELGVMSRTFNQTANGTFGQSLPGVPAAGLIPAGTEALVLFLTENSVFRSNLGLLNGVGSPITLQWELFDSAGSSLGTGSVVLPAWGNTQLNRVLSSYAPVEAGYAHLWTDTTGGAFTCYGSVLDEITSDPTTVLPQ